MVVEGKIETCVVCMHRQALPLRRKLSVYAITKEVFAGVACIGILSKNMCVWNIAGVYHPGNDFEISSQKTKGFKTRKDLFEGGDT